MGPSVRLWCQKPPPIQQHQHAQQLVVGRGLTVDAWSRQRDRSARVRAFPDLGEVAHHVHGAGDRKSATRT